MLFTTVVVGTVLSEDDVCGNFIEHDHDSIGHYDREECNACREYGKGKGDCCDALYCFHHNLGPIYDSQPCRVMDEECTVGKGMCIPGMRCVGTPGKCVRQPRRYDPNLGDGCFTDNETPDNYCWSVYNISFPEGNWKGEGGRGSNDCGTRCTKMYNPQYQGEYCFQDNDTPDNYCWYPTDNFPVGHWKRAFFPPKKRWEHWNHCGSRCTAVYPSGHYTAGTTMTSTGPPAHRHEDASITARSVGLSAALLASVSVGASSFSTHSTITEGGGPSVVVVVVGTLGAALLALTVVLQRRHRGLLRRHQYSEVDATAPRLYV